MIAIKKAQPSGTVASLVQAEEVLKPARATFQDGQYEEAIAAAKKAKEAARKVGS